MRILGLSVKAEDSQLRGIEFLSCRYFTACNLYVLNWRNKKRHLNGTQQK
jgi:hypothetical protein